MSRYLRGRLERLQGRIGEPAGPDTREARAQARTHMVEYLAHIADARRNGDWTEEDAAREREAIRDEAEKRGLVNGSLYRY